MKKRLPIVALLLVAVAFGLWAGFALRLDRELSYHLGSPTAAEQKVHAYAKEKRYRYGSYPKELIELLERNPETEEFVLAYPEKRPQEISIEELPQGEVPLFLQWDSRWGYEAYGSGPIAVTGCGPSCLAMAGYALTGDEAMNPLNLATFAEKNGYYAKGYGSSWTLISKGAEQLGLKAKELPLVKQKMVDAVKAGHPVILALGKGDFTSSGHYIVLTDYQEDAFLIRDPNSKLRSAQSWSYEQLEPQIRNIWELSKES